MSHTKLSLAGNSLIITGQGEFGKYNPGWGRGKWLTSFYSIYKKFHDILTLYIWTILSLIN
jgi:hypothetical protein